MRIPRDINGKHLASLLAQYGYAVTRQSGSHIRLTSSHTGVEHHITIPEHNPLRVGTLSGILNDVASYLKIGKEELINQLFAG